MDDTSAILELFNTTLKSAIDLGASDIHIKSDGLLNYRVNGSLVPGDKKFSSEQISRFLEVSLPYVCRPKWLEESQIDYNYSISSESVRFRVNCFNQRGLPAIVFRLVQPVPPTFEDLNLDFSCFKEICTLKDGLVLVCGPTGSGKSSTLASFLDYINSNLARNIVTLEDPIEFTHQDKKGIVNQREIGIDVPSFNTGLKGALRQDPDVILVGEMRDPDTLETALWAAETGHLVFSSLHAINARQVFHRLLDFFPEGEYGARCRQLAGLIRAIISQRLIPTMNSDARMPVTEVFRVTGVARSILERGQFEKIDALIDADENAGSQSFNTDLHRLVSEGHINAIEAYSISPNPKALEMKLKGIDLNRGVLLGE